MDIFRSLCYFCCIRKYKYAAVEDDDLDEKDDDDENKPLVVKAEKGSFFSKFSISEKMSSVYEKVSRWSLPSKREPKNIFTMNVGDFDEFEVVDKYI